VDIGNLIVGQYFEINTFNLNFTAANGTIHFISSFLWVMVFGARL
jgi:hypothetical protein